MKSLLDWESHNAPPGQVHPSAPVTVSDPKIRAATVENAGTKYDTTVAARRDSTLSRALLDSRLEFKGKSKPETTIVKPTADIKTKFDNSLVKNLLPQPDGKSNFLNPLDRVAEIIRAVESNVVTMAGNLMTDIAPSETPRVDINIAPVNTNLDRTVNVPKINSASAVSNLGSVTDFLKYVTTNMSAVKFTPFRFSVLTLNNALDVSALLNSASETPNLVIPKGRYLFHFSVPTTTMLPNVAIVKPIPFTVSGKQQLLEKASLDFSTGRVILQIRIVENPIFIPIMIVAGLAAAGLAGFGIEKSLKQVDRIIVDTTEAAGKLIVYGIIGGAAFLVLRAKMRKG